MRFNTACLPETKSGQLNWYPIMAVTLLMRGEGFTLLKLVEAVESFTQTHPWLAALRAWALELTGHLDEVEACAAESGKPDPFNHRAGV